MARRGYPPEVRLRARMMWIGGTKSDAQIARELGLPREDTIGQWRRTEHWDRERQYVEKVTEQRVEVALAETIAAMNARHLKEFQLLQTKGIQALRRLDPQKASEALSMVDVGVRGERLVRGEPSEIHEVRTLMRANIEVLELCVADVIRALMESSVIDRRVAKQFAELFSQKVNDAPFQYVPESGK